MKKKEVTRICITYPPFDYNDSFPLISLNRQFKWLRRRYFSYPILPSYAATLLKTRKYNVLFLDSISRKMNTVEWFNAIEEFNPHLLFFEAKTPTINYTWDTISAIKKKFKNIYIVLAGDHVTALPLESFENSEVDFVITTGDYDVLLLSIVNYLNFGDKLEKGIYFRNSKGNIKYTGKYSLNYDINTLPFIDRNLTNWKLYSNNKLLFKRTPGTYIMSARGSLYNSYNSVSSNILFPSARVRSVHNVVDEIEYLYKRYNIREILDNTIHLPPSDWLENFCDEMIYRKLHKKININCYVYLNAFDYSHYRLMKKSGFKTVVFNLPSSNNKTLEQLGIKDRVEDIVESIKLAKKAGLFVDLIVKFGYPWESEEDILNTFELVQDFMLGGYIRVMNASLYIPYPGNTLFDYCNENNLLETKNWFEYDMRRAIMKVNGIEDERLFKNMENFYKLYFSPSYLFKTLISARDIYDFRYNFRFLRYIFMYFFNKN